MDIVTETTTTVKTVPRTPWQQFLDEVDERPVRTWADWFERIGQLDVKKAVTP